MKIAVISDTHIDDRISWFPRGFLQTLRGFDIVIHCGDFTSLRALEAFEDFPAFYGVAGNMDEPDVRRILPETRVVKSGGLNVGVIHGWGAPYGLAQRVYSAMLSKYPDTRFDIILCGHSHRPFEETIGGIRILNPGSVAGNIFSSHGSWGELEIDGDTIKWTLHKIDRAHGGLL